VTGRQLLVFRDPHPDAAHPRGHNYAPRLAFGPADAVAPLAAPAGPVRVADLLPEAPPAALSRRHPFRCCIARDRGGIIPRIVL
jgi:hypothetical protein